MADPEARAKLTRRRVYVDEIQDYTQAEIALFFLLCGQGGLFLAGDPAQSVSGPVLVTGFIVLYVMNDLKQFTIQVVEGVEFRFEEVRLLLLMLFAQIRCNSKRCLFLLPQVRSVAYHLHPDDKRYIPEKPLTGM